MVQLAVNEPPTGKIEIEDNSWTGFLDSDEITFNLFFNETKQVTITAQDTDSGVDTIYWYPSERGMTKAQVKELGASAWREYREGTSFPLEPDRKCVIYVKITDEVGNVTYLSSDGLVFDAAPPVINGVTDGETYNAPQTVSVTDALSGVKSVTVNGTEVTLTDNQFTLGTAENPQTIVVTDKAGNTAAVTATVQAQTQTYAVTVHNGSGTGNYKAGDTVTITADAPESGKQFDKWRVVTGGITLADSTSIITAFTMPKRDVDVEATYKDITEEHTHDFGDWITDREATAAEAGTKHRECQTCGYRQTETIPATGTEQESGTVTPEVKPGDNAPATDISTPTEELKDMLLTDEEEQQVQNGINIRIILEVQDARNTVSASERADVAQALNGYTEGQYLNIDLYKLVGADRTDITNTAKKIKIVITVPDSLKNADSSRIRTFAVIRLHDGRADILTDLDGSADTITIETDRFSTYAIVYKDTANSSDDDNNNGNGNPDTGDAAPLEVYATLAMIAGFSYLLLYFTGRKRGMTEETKRELVSRLVGWAKRGGRLRKCLALAAVFVLLAYYHSIGKKTCAEWKEIYG